MFSKMRCELLLGTILIILLIDNSVALPLSDNKNNNTSNEGYTCCVTPTVSCKCALIGSCISCPTAETPVTALECAVAIAGVVEDCIKCYDSECSTCPTNMIEWNHNVNKHKVPMAINSYNSNISASVSNHPTP